MVFLRMADDLVKVTWTKDFRVKEFWGDQMVFRWNRGAAHGHCQQGVGLLRLTCLRNLRKRRHQKSIQELYFTL